jgi:UDP-N-acetyl-D-mannosaminuronic acid dehydrogenase
VAVPTPFQGDYQPDLKYIEAAANALAPFLKKEI